MDKNMVINAPTSIGDLLDRISILTIKTIRVADHSKLDNIQTELNALIDVVKQEVHNDPYDGLYVHLLDINQQLWDIEDTVRECEMNKDFGSLFIEAARTVYKLNDARCAIKREINMKYGSGIVEEKSYAKTSTDH